ncbi:MAG: sugar transferase [Lachnospiraceae bacterium]|nr:sugar transferase [Lachnospiraceae bacterium]
MQCAPVIIFVYDRVDRFIEVYKSLCLNKLINETDLYIFSDAYDERKNNKFGVDQVRDYINIVKSENLFKNIRTVLAETHKGLANSVIDGVTQIIKEYGSVIVLEDDLIVSDSFLDYMNRALVYYEKNSKIWSISGYTLSFHRLNNYKYDVYGAVRGDSWGWATWKDRWEKVRWDIPDFEEFLEDVEAQKRFNYGGADMTNLLISQKKGLSDSWAIRWNYQQFRENMISIFPTRSQVKNMGWSGDGTNCDKAILKIWDTKIKTYDEMVKFYDCEVDKAIMKKTQRAYSKSLLQRIILILDKI